jgi:osmotically-inducible protein OsmY
MIKQAHETAPLEERVRRVLTENPHLTQRTLRIETHEGCVTLKGVVRSFYQKQMAQESLKGVEGLVQIENQLQVVW